MSIIHSNTFIVLKKIGWIVSITILGVLTVAAYMIGFGLSVLSVFFGGFTILSAASDRDARKCRRASH